ncbi:hypothetical protein GCM10010103_07440 [Streptomyces paradoxus]|uniref:Capsular polysaccharide biosynthesis protein n=1 Tax=Streptomyces paradoxus TaxID=66375 RepID=A0A7W9WDC6_9ACTN|nr:capsular polysaccharide biosynthesis protein [Streptomyces paradoxus]
MSQWQPQQSVGDGARTTPDTAVGPSKDGGAAASTAASPQTSPPRHGESAGPPTSGDAGTARSASARRRGALAALLAGLLVLAGGLVVIEQLPTRYSTTSTISFAPRSQPNVSADVIELVANKYAVVAASTTSVASAAAAASVTRAELRDALSISVEANTANLDIAVSLANARAAATAANTIAAAVNRAAADDQLIAGEITARADPVSAQLQPSRSLLRVIAVAAALLVAGWVSFAARQISRRAGRPQ